MATILDAGPLIAALDQRDRHHEMCAEFFARSREALIISPFVIAEVDHYSLTRLGVDVEIGSLRDVAAQTHVERIDNDDVQRCADIAEQYRDLAIGIADASIILLAERHDTDRIATLDRRHFRAFRSMRGNPFVLLPWDEGQRTE